MTTKLATTAATILGGIGLLTAFHVREAGPAFELVVATEGNTVRYRVEEQLVGVDLPGSAVGETNAVTGTIVIDSAGAVLPASSKIVASVGGLRSDSERRDGYVSRRVLGTTQYPTVELVPSATRGFAGSLPASGTRAFTLIGDLTVRGVTRRTTWQVEAAFAGDRVTGRASTSFAFSDFELTKPRVPVVLSVADTIRLEYDFTLLRRALPSP